MSDCDLARQDIEEKYEMVLNQSDVGTLIAKNLQKVDPSTTSLPMPQTGGGIPEAHQKNFSFPMC